MQLHLTLLQVGRRLMNIHKNIEMVTRTRTRMRYEQDVKSTLGKLIMQGPMQIIRFNLF